MTLDRFWEIVEQSRVRADSDEKQEAKLRQLLEPLDPDEILSFEIHFQNLENISYSEELWDVVEVMEGYRSNDGFEYFRYGLIAEGRERFESTLRDPDSLCDWCKGFIEFESIAYVAWNVYEGKTGKDFFEALHEFMARNPVNRGD